MTKQSIKQITRAELTEARRLVSVGQYDAARVLFAKHGIQLITPAEHARFIAHVEGN